ncbi:hypothetical protein L1049_004863 [Liquidambar formosana]|uniref:Small auxin up regulated protein n=1 Tax=Liquidambar formosana TaxID=63359 RepID=A0AAP0RNU8_LIQFO
MATTIKKVEKIRQIVQLLQIMKRWKARSTLKRKHLLTLSSTDSSDSDSSSPLSASTHRVPSGFLAVYVGMERQRFLIPTRYLNFPVFVALLKKAEEEYGFKFSGGIVLPCEVDFFVEVLKFLDKDERKFGKLELDEFLKIFSEVGFDSSSCKEGYHYSCNGFSPLMQAS